MYRMVVPPMSTKPTITSRLIIAEYKKKDHVLHMALEIKILA